MTHTTPRLRARTPNPTPALRQPALRDVSAVYRAVTAGRVRDPFAAATTVLAAATEHTTTLTRLHDLDAVTALFDAGYTDAARHLARHRGLWTHDDTDPQE